MIANRKALRNAIGTLAAALLGTMVIAAPAQASFHITEFSGGTFNQDGTSASQAASHPYAGTTKIEFPTFGFAEPDGLVKEINAELPPGLVGNPSITPVRCTSEQLAEERSACPAASQVGVATIKTALFPLFPIARSAIYNIEPPPGSAALFGFRVLKVPAYLFPHVRTGEDNGLTVRSPEITQIIPITAVTIEFWGVPADPSHDVERGTPSEAGFDSNFEYCAELEDPGCSNPAGYEPKAFVTTPSDCSAGPLTTTAHANSYEEPGTFHTASFNTDTNGNPTEVTGCADVPFEPEISAKPSTDLADSPSGFDVDISVPSEGLNDPNGIAQANLKKAVVTLPRGLTVNAASADGLGACSTAQIGLTTGVGQSPIHFTPNRASCPDSARVGTVSVKTPLLDHPLPGFVYLASQNDNPFGSLLALYIVIDDPATNTLVKLAGRVSADPDTGQLSASFDDNPQLPFEHFEVSFFGGSHASLKTPLACGTFTTTTEMTPWSAPEGKSAAPASSFDITRGAGGGACSSSEATAPHKPSFTAGTVDPTAGAFTPFVLKLARADGTQPIKAIDTTLPKGLVGKLAGVPYCSDAALSAAAGKSGKAEQASSSCPAASEVGTVNVSAGAGPAPLNVGGKAYLAGPYKGAPLSLAIITPAVAGPFDLGTVVVRTALRVDPASAQIHAVSDEIPTILQGIPLDVRTISVNLARPQFTLNPTSCDPMAVTGSALSAFNQSASLSNPFQVGDCGKLAFKPALSIRLKGGTKRDDNPALTATLTYPAGANANIAGASVALPRSAFLDQSHIGTVCTRVQFAADQCPAKSVYGFARAISPLLDQPLEGPVYLRSSDNPLPDLVAALKGQIDVDLAGRIDTVRGGIRTSFEGVPDAPVSKFTLAMKGGKKGLLVNSRNICKHTYRATASFTAQNGKAFESRPVLKNSCKKARKGKRGKHKKG